MANDIGFVGDYAYERKSTIVTAKDIYVYPSAQSDDGGDVNHEHNIRSISDKLICKNFVVRKLVDKEKQEKDPTTKPLEVTQVDDTTVSVSKGEAVIDGYYTNIKKDSVSLRIPVTSSGGIIPDTCTTTTTASINDSELREAELQVLSVYTGNIVEKTNSGTQTYTSGLVKYVVEDSDDINDDKITERTFTYNQAWSIYNNIQILNDDTSTDEAKTRAREALSEISKYRRKFAKELIKKKSLYLCIVLLANSTGNLRGDITKRDATGVLRYNQGVSFRFHTGEEIDRGDITRPYLVLGQVVPKYVDSGFEIGYVINDPNKYAYIDPDAIVSEDGMTFKEWVIAYVKEKLETLDRLTYVETDPSKDEIDEEDILDWIKKILAELILSYDDLDVIRYRVDDDNGYSYDEDGNIITVPLSEDKDYGLPDERGHSEESDPIADTTTYKDHGFDKTYSIDEMQRRTHVDSSTEPYKWRGTLERVDNTREFDDEIRISTFAPRVDSRDSGHGHHDNYPETYRTGRTASANNINANNGTSRLLARADHNHGTRYIFSTDAIEDDSGHTQTVGTNLTVNHNETVKKKLTVEGDTELKRNLSVGTDNSIPKKPIINVSCWTAPASGSSTTTTIPVTSIKGRINLEEPNSGNSDNQSNISLLSCGHIKAHKFDVGNNTYYSKISTLAGDIYAGKETVDGTTTYGNIYTVKGDIYTGEDGKIYTRYNTAKNDGGVAYSDIKGDIYAEGTGRIHTKSGDIYTETGSIRVIGSGDIGTEKGKIYVKTTLNNTASSNAIEVTKGSLLLTEGNATLTNGNVDVSGGRTNLRKHLIVGRTEGTSGTNSGKILVSGSTYLTPSDGTIYAVSVDLTGGLLVRGVTSLSDTTISGTLTVTGDITTNSNVIIKGGYIKTNQSTLHVASTTSGGTASLTIDKGDMTVSSGNINVSSGNITAFNKVTAHTVNATQVGSNYLTVTFEQSSGQVYFGTSSDPYLIVNTSGTVISDLKVTGDAQVQKELSVDKKYIKFGTGSSAIRLYVSETAPEDNDIPEGSIGIGW